MTGFRGSAIIYGGMKHNTVYWALGVFVWPVQLSKLWPARLLGAPTFVLLEITKRCDRANCNQGLSANQQLDWLCECVS